MARLRLWGRPTAAGREALGRRWFDALPDVQALEVLGAAGVPPRDAGRAGRRPPAGAATSPAPRWSPRLADLGQSSGLTGGGRRPGWRVETDPRRRPADHRRRARRDRRRRPPGDRRRLGGGDRRRDQRAGRAGRPEARRGPHRRRPRLPGHPGPGQHPPPPVPEPDPRLRARADRRPVRLAGHAVSAVGAAGRGGRATSAPTSGSPSWRWAAAPPRPTTCTCTRAAPAT